MPTRGSDPPLLGGNLRHLGVGGRVCVVVPALSLTCQRTGRSVPLLALFLFLRLLLFSLLYVVGEMLYETTVSQQTQGFL